MKNSLKLLLPLAGLILLAAPVLRADDPPAPPAAAPSDKPEHGGGGGGRRGGPGAMFDKLAKDLNLTADQQAKWKDINDQERAAAKPIMTDESLSKEDKRAKMMDLNKTYAAQRRAVLDADQQTKFDDAVAKMRERGPRGPKKDKPADTN